MLGIKDVNTSLRQIHEELDSKCSVEELERVKSE